MQEPNNLKQCKYDKPQPVLRHIVPGSQRRRGRERSRKGKGIKKQAVKIILTDIQITDG